jgi:hypothetical protein
MDGSEKKRPTPDSPNPEADGQSVRGRRPLHGQCHGLQRPWPSSGMLLASTDVSRARRWSNHLAPSVSSGGANQLRELLWPHAWPPQLFLALPTLLQCNPGLLQFSRANPWRAHWRRRTNACHTPREAAGWKSLTSGAVCDGGCRSSRFSAQLCVWALCRSLSCLRLRPVQFGPCPWLSVGSSSTV